MKKFIISLITLCIAISANAAEYPWTMRSVAALGMGDAYYTKSDSKYAPFYNPAGLARIKPGAGKVDLLPLGLGANANAFEFYRDFDDLDTDNNTDVANFLSERIGEYQHIGVSLYPGYTRQNFTAGIFGSARVNAIATNPVIPELDVQGIADYGLVVGFGANFLQERLQVGIAGRIQKRHSYERIYSVADIVNDELDEFGFDDFEDEVGILTDIGVIYNFSTDGLNPRIGVALNNVGTNRFGKAIDQPYTVNLSFGISPSYGIMTSDIIIDLRDITRNIDDDDDWAKRINAGIELRFWEKLALRAGLHQGYLTFGAGVDFKYLRVDYAYYREEIGAYAGQKDDERHALEVVFGF